MPFKQKAGGSIEFIRLPLNKCVYGVEKGKQGSRYLYLRRFDMSGVKYDSIKNFAGSLLDAIDNTSFEDDWIIPIGTTNELDYGMLQKYADSPCVRNFIATPANSRPWFSVVRTPNNVVYFTKCRISASTTLQTMGLVASLANPVTAAGALAWFARKQHAKYKFSKSRGEQDPSIMPKVFVHKIWQVSVSGEPEEVYKNIAHILETGTA